MGEPLAPPASPAAPSDIAAWWRAGGGPGAGAAAASGATLAGALAGIWADKAVGNREGMEVRVTSWAVAARSKGPEALAVPPVLPAASCRDCRGGEETREVPPNEGLRRRGRADWQGQATAQREAP